LKRREECLEREVLKRRVEKEELEREWRLGEESGGGNGILEMKESETQSCILYFSIVANQICRNLQSCMFPE
jgi:hypothetical protein